MRKGLVRVSAPAVIAFLLTAAALVPANEQDAPSKVETSLEAASNKTGAEADATSPEAAKDTKWKVTRPDLSKPIMEADNSYCIVCHADFEEEELVDIHIGVGVGCETCHGMSIHHSADEDGMTPPEIMWAKQRINPRCMTCHPREELLEGEASAEPHLEMLRRWEDPKNAGPGEKYCFQCHGEHRMKHRTRQWDQETGKLLKRLGGPVMDK